MNGAFPLLLESLPAGRRAEGNSCGDGTQPQAAQLASASWGEGRTAPSGPPRAGLPPMSFFKEKCPCCQERVCLSLGDSSCQARENSKHVKNSSARRLRGCNFLLKCRLRSGQKSPGLSVLPAACGGGCLGSRTFARGGQRGSAGKTVSGVTTMRSE